MDEKIWFVYLTDHHEGPFSPAEVAEKAKQGLVSGQTLGWKDGMPEWIPVDSIPELAAALGSSAEAPPVPLAAMTPASGGEEDFSLAKLLVSEQQNAPTLSMGSGNEDSAPSIAGFISPDSEVWTLRVGNQVSGLHSLQRLKDLAASGDVPADAQVWHPGWSDFKLVSAVPEVAAARKAKPAGGMSGIGSLQRSQPARGVQPLANVGDEEPTDPGIAKPKASGGILGLFGGKAPVAMAKVQRVGPVGIPQRPSQSARLMASLKKVVSLLLFIGILGGGAAGYFFFFASPIPRDLDVIEDDHEAMNLVVKAPIAEGGKLVLALARGTEDNPAEDTSPKFYVATNMEEGTAVTLKVVGVPGTLLNRLAYEKTLTSQVGKNKLATFENLSEDGKPLPIGEYTLSVSAEGAETISRSRFLGGKKGGVYADRLKKYREKLQGDYDKEVQELREYVQAIKSLQGEATKQINSFKEVGANPANRPRLAADWKAFHTNSQAMIAQVDGKLKQRAAAGASANERAFQDMATVLGQLQQLLELHDQRLSGATPKSNPDEMEGLVQAGVLSLEQLVSQALMKSPFDAAAPAPASTK